MNKLTTILITSLALISCKAQIPDAYSQRIIDSMRYEIMIRDTVIETISTNNEYLILANADFQNQIFEKDLLIDSIMQSNCDSIKIVAQALQADGEHPNTAGHAIITRLIKEKILKDQTIIQ